MKKFKIKNLVDWKLFWEFMIGLVFLVCLVSSAPAQEAEKSRPPITPEDLAMTDLPEYPGAPAVCLYYERKDDRQQALQSVFKRIKILKPAGRDLANLEIFYFSPFNEVKNIKVKVIDPDGSSREVRPDILEKVVSKFGWSEYRAKTLAIPDISPGQIIEYEYQIDRAENSGFVSLVGGGISIRVPVIIDFQADYLSHPAISWDLQDRLYTREARYVFVSDPYVGVSKGGKYNLAWVPNRLTDFKARPTERGLELEVNHIPPFEKEEFMPPVSSEKITFDVIYLSPQIKNIDLYWEEASRLWKKDAEEFMGKPKSLLKEVKNIVGAETEPEARLKKIYDRVQKIKNLDYVREMTAKEEKKIKENKNVNDILKHNYGHSNQISKTFAALARAAGFETYLVRVVSRDNKLFRPQLPLFLKQFDKEIVMVKIGDRCKPFDSATPFCPFGLVYWPNTNTAAVTFENDQMRIFTSPALGPEMAQCQREAQLVADEHGNLVGSIRVKYEGQEALVRRLKYMDEDELRVKKELEEELRKVLPAGSQASMKSLSGLREDSSPLLAEFEVVINGVINEAGGRLIMTVYPLTNPERYPFRSAIRKYPIYFNYPFTELDDITINLPENYQVEVWPRPLKKDSFRAGFALEISQSEPCQIKISRELTIKKSYYDVSEYVHLKDFFDYVQSGDSRQLILRR